MDSWRLKESIIVKNEASMDSYTFSVKKSEGITLEAQADGSITSSIQTQPETLLKIDAPYAVGRNKERGRIMSAYTLGKVTYKEVEYDANNRYLLTIVDF